MKRFSSHMLPLTADTVVAFDLDDTLYREADFLASGFAAVADCILARCGIAVLADLQEFWARDAKDVFHQMIDKHGLRERVSKEEMVELYRFHQPSLTLAAGTRRVLDTLRNRGVALSVITDGRSRTQRNKLRALGIVDYFDPIVISEEIGTEKPAEQNFRRVMDRYPGHRFVYVGDNTKKDFFAPRRLEWTTICIRDDGRNVHRQNFEVGPEYLPDYLLDSLEELIGESDLVEA